ncbi:MAG: bifunctional isocitrate dehydrogenase kinase/phosphatase, partial [Chlamydiia bacterium]|nr:bifunctional isocitrate dehydrogenase kinase/phosphatase [Chlamydiia bacterium]
MFTQLIPYETTHLILSAYIDYYHQFKRITKRARYRFETKDWQGLQADSRKRNLLYKELVQKTTNEVLDFLGDKAKDRKIWAEIRHSYQLEVMNFKTRNIAETFYNSVFRHINPGLSADEELMFVHGTGTYREYKSTHPIYFTFYLSSPLENTFVQLFSFFNFDVPFEDLDQDIKEICDTFEQRFLQGKIIHSTDRLEVLKSVFYRNKGAYIVGRTVISGRVHPFILPLQNREKGLAIDALLLDRPNVSSIFSYHRSYFLVDVDIVRETVDFIWSMLPNKNLGELYNSIGFVKHGKTVFYRSFVRHLERSEDKFIRAPGAKGMVMTVFTLPSYKMVFKVIRDQFAFGKKQSPEMVKAKYDLVHLHDRVGRMTDFHSFDNMVFDVDRFSPQLLEELKKEIPSKLTFKGNKVEISHLYAEKRMIPLDLYLKDASLEDAEKVISDFGLAIKQLASVNIFTGDMLLRNFGVTALKRVVLYDYDEIGFLNQYNFRVMPQADNDEDNMRAEPWFHVGEKDVFPEEFINFLTGKKELKEIFYRTHGDLFTVDFWNGVKEKW